MGERFGRDSIWETHLAEQLRGTEVELDVVLDETTMSLADVMKLEVGSRIMLHARPGAAVQVRCGAVPLFAGRVGRKKDQVAVRIEEVLARIPAIQPAEQV
jgi:flagellar motor switch protein FliM